MPARYSPILRLPPPLLNAVTHLTFDNALARAMSDFLRRLRDAGVRNIHTENAYNPTSMARLVRTYKEYLFDQWFPAPTESRRKRNRNLNPRVTPFDFSSFFDAILSNSDRPALTIIIPDIDAFIVDLQANLLAGGIRAYVRALELVTIRREEYDAMHEELLSPFEPIPISVTPADLAHACHFPPLDPMDAQHLWHTVTEDLRNALTHFPEEPGYYPSEVLDLFAAAAQKHLRPGLRPLLLPAAELRRYIDFYLFPGLWESLNELIHVKNWQRPPARRQPVKRKSHSNLGA